jgi:hypothetical protein
LCIVLLQNTFFKKKLLLKKDKDNVSPCSLLEQAPTQI